MAPRSRRLAEDARRTDELAISAVSFWEIAILVGRGRLRLEQPINTWRRTVLGSRISEAPVSGSAGILSVELDGLPRDPAGRMIVATALETGATLMTADERILGWVRTLSRHDART